MSNSGATIPCPSCGTPSSGKYCAECGSALMGATCASCGALMTPGARFCHRCGAPAGVRGAAAAPPPTPDSVAAPRALSANRSVVPWVVGVAALLALVIAVAVQQSTTTPAPGAPTAGDVAAAPPFAGGAPVRAPDISSLTPRERADRLYDRVMRQAAEGKTDSATFFASMATQAYELLGQLDNDLRYDYGRMAEVAGNLELAQAQVDTILASHPDHLLGLTLGARVAQLRNDGAARDRYNGRLLAVEGTELKKPLDEYTRHRGDIDAAIAEARAAKR